MNHPTLDKIKNEAEIALNKLRNGENITLDQLRVLEIYNGLLGKKSTNGGKRQNRVKKQRIK